MSIRPIQWKGDRLVLLDQTLLPRDEVYREYVDHREVARAISDMVVRGAPAIGVSAAFGIVLAARALSREEPAAFHRGLDEACATLAATRPTAVNLFWAIERMKETARCHAGEPARRIAEALEAEARTIFEEDVQSNRRIGRFGAELLPETCAVLTHCNAGALATAGYGTALGVIRAAVEAGKRVSVIADETRPFLQGCRLTAWELQRDGIAVTLIADNMAGYRMRRGGVDAVIVGADRIAANGDVANKIGTYSLSVLARENRVPFYVAAPLSTVDFRLPTGGEIPIEERDPREMTHLVGQRLAPEGIEVWNPAFDITPAANVTAIVTDRGVIRAPYLTSLEATRQSPGGASDDGPTAR